jgi:hypothetical protein
MGKILHCYSVAVRSYPFFLPIWVEKDLPEATNVYEVLYVMRTPSQTDVRSTSRPMALAVASDAMTGL